MEIEKQKYDQLSVSNCCRRRPPCDEDEKDLVYLSALSGEQNQPMNTGKHLFPYFNATLNYLGKT